MCYESNGSLYYTMATKMLNGDRGLLTMQPNSTSAHLLDIVFGYAPFADEY